MRDLREPTHWTSKTDFPKFGMVQGLLNKVAHYLELDDAAEPAAPPKVRIRRRKKRIGLAQDSITGEIDGLSDKLPPDFAGLIIDAGSNIGTSAIALANLFPQATIVAIEPSSRYMAMLRANTAHLKNIRPVHAALAPTAGQKIALRDHGRVWGFSPMDAGHEPRVEEVLTTSIDAIRDQYPYLELGLVKIDIAGAEKALFEEAADQFADVPFVFAELHEHEVPGCEAAFRRICENRIEERIGGDKYLSQLMF